MNNIIEIPHNINEVIKNEVRYERNFDFIKWSHNRANVLFNLANIVSEEDEIGANYLLIASQIYKYHANICDRFMALFTNGEVNFISSAVYDVQYIPPHAEIICKNDEFGPVLDNITDIGVFAPLVDIEISNKIEDNILISKIDYWKYVFTIAIHFTIRTLIIYALNHIVHNIFYHTYDMWPDKGQGWPMSIFNMLGIKISPIAYCSHCGLPYCDMTGIYQCSCGGQKGAFKKWPKNIW